MSRLPRAIVGICVVLAFSACGGQQSSSQPAGVTISSIKAAMSKSSMKNAHFSVVGNIVQNGASYPIEGDGVLQRSPAALEINLTLLTYAATGDIHLQQIQIGGMVYSKLGSGAWTSQRETSSISPLQPTGYAGEDTRAGQLVWHVRSSDSSSAYDMWIRETDAYVVLISYKDSAGETFNFIMNSYNKSPVIAAPAS